MPKTYRREIWRRTWTDWKRGHWLWLVRTIFLWLAGALAAWLWTGKHVTLSSLLVGALGGLGAALLWAAISFLVSLFKAPMSLLRERDESLAALSLALPTGPRIEATVEWERDFGTASARLLLVVTNLSPSASFWAVLKNTSGLMFGWPRREVFAKWDHHNAVKAQIPKGGRHSLLVGRLQDDHREGWSSGQWHVPYTSDQETGEARAVCSFDYGTSEMQRETVYGSIVEFCVTLYSDPDMTAGPMLLDVELAGGAPKITSRHPSFKGPESPLRG